MMPRFVPALLALRVVVGDNPVKLIIDTDIGGGGCIDVDDVAALAVGHALVDNGEAELLAIVVNTSPLKGPGAVSVMNHLYGRDDVPIGSYKGSDLPVTLPDLYIEDMVDRWDSPIKEASQVPSSVEVYRRALASQPDSSVVIASIGVMTNLRALLESEADEFSPLSGSELVAQKVKLLVAMAGKYPSGTKATAGSECNMAGGNTVDIVCSAASAYVFSSWPASAEVLFLGFEVGVDVLTGGRIYDCVPSTSPVRQAYIDFVGYGNRRPSWDPMAVLIAVRGAGGGGCRVCSNCDGKVGVNSTTGENWWIPGPASNQAYLELNDADFAVEALDSLMCQDPSSTPSGPFIEKLEATAVACAEDYSRAWDDYSKAWDDDMTTFYNSAKADGACTQAQLAVESPVSRIQFYPRANFSGGNWDYVFWDQCVGGEFIGITAEGTSVSLGTIPSNSRVPWVNNSFLDTGVSVALTSVKYHGPNGSHGNMAEIQLFTRSSSRAMDVVIV